MNYKINCKYFLKCIAHIEKHITFESAINEIMKDKTIEIRRKWFYELQDRVQSRLHEKCYAYQTQSQFVANDFVFEVYLCQDMNGNHIGSICAGMFKVDKGHKSYPGYIKFYAETQNDFTFQFTNR